MSAKPHSWPAVPHFSSGPCAKRPGWSLSVLTDALVGRSHRSKPGRAKLKRAIDLTREVLEVPSDYRIGIVPGIPDAARDPSSYEERYDGGPTYLNDPRMTSFTIPYPDKDEALKSLVDRLRKNGSFQKGYFYVVDEPATEEALRYMEKIVGEMVGLFSISSSEAVGRLNRFWQGKSSRRRSRWAFCCTKRPPTGRRPSTTAATPNGGLVRRGYSPNRSRRSGRSAGPVFRNDP